MPEVIMQYEDYEGKMIAMKRKEELIRCKDCKHYCNIRRTTRHWCNSDDGMWVDDLKPDDFCSQAERKTK